MQSFNMVGVLFCNLMEKAMRWMAFVMIVVFIAYAIVAHQSDTGMVDGKSAEDLLVMGFLGTACCFVFSFANKWCAQMLEKNIQE
jgi:hypothetical protein